jgi:ABC-2 type transport system permease protein
MNRVRIVATTEFLALVRTKAFIIGIIMVPVLIGLSIGFQSFAARQNDVGDHRFAVIDRTGRLFDAVAADAADHDARAVTNGTRTGPRFLPERVPPDEADPVALSERVRHGDLFAFVDIPATVLDPLRGQAEQISYYTETPSYSALPSWLHETLDREITDRRFEVSNLDSALVARLTRATEVTTLGLFERRPDGSIVAARRSNQLKTFITAFGMVYLLFIALMTSAPQLLTAIVEEKMSRISEVLISSITPVQLLAGKLIGVSAVAVLLALLYLAGGAYAAVTSGQIDLVRPALVGWFLVYLIGTVLLFGAIFVAIGAMCSDLKDSQAIMQSVMILVVMPLFMSPIVLRAPNSLLSVLVSLFPTTTPFLMLMRLSLTPAPPGWQVALSLAIMAGTVAVVLWVSGRIVRVGLLMQGKPPNLPELMRWIRQ